ncbi:MAG: succinate dehydrogenase, cytochrome b556 subunit [Legionellales bacterium]|nr:succinate dehydrogenase, cytochrome b556 subunit [Legionellales bacterium]
MKKNRPVNLDLTTISFPLPAIVSILHRLSGVLLFLIIPLLLWTLQQSAFSEEGFLNVQDALTSTLSKVIIWVLLSAMIYHLIAGIRHLLMDMGIGEERKSGKVGAFIALGLSIVCAILVGVWLW